MKQYCKTALFLMAVFCCMVLSAAKIGKITFVQESESKLPEQMLRFNIQEKSGQQFDEKILNDDIKRLSATGFISDIVAEHKPAAGGTVDIVIKLKIKPRVKKIIIKGNKKFTTEKLMDQITLSPEAPLNDHKYRESANALRQFYKGEGYNEAQVTPELKQVGKEGVNVVFNVKENLRLKVDDVYFEGATVFTQWKLKNSIATRYSFLSWILDQGLYNPDEIEDDKARLREMYYEKGYLDFKVEKVTVVNDKDNPEYVDVTFKLFEGKPYKVNSVKVIGCHRFKDQQIRGMIPLQKDVRFNSQLERSARKAIQNKYENLGYMDASCMVNRVADYSTHTVDLVYKVSEGRSYTVKDVMISGNRITKDKVIRRELAIQPGDPVDKNRIEASKSRLMGMDYFKKVEAVAVNSDEVGKKNIHFNVEEKKTYEFKIGAGFSDTESLVGMLQLSNKNFDITDPGNWFSGGGQRLRFQAMAGIKRFNMNLDFSEPWLFDMPLRLDVNGYWNTVAYEYWNEERVGARMSLTKRVFDDFTRAAFMYKYEWVRVYDVDDDRSQEIKEWEGGSFVSQVQLTLTRDTRDSIIEPTTGYQLAGLAALASKGLGGSYDFYRLELKGDYHYSWFDKAIRMHLAGKIGVVPAFNRNNQSPIYERYFLGGVSSLRGFPYRNVSPVDINGDNIGGQSMALVRAEVSHPIWNFIRGAAFVDAGNAWYQSYSFGLGALNVGAGYGLRIKVPKLNAAPLEIDIAYPVVSNQSDLNKKIRFHFNMGFTW